MAALLLLLSAFYLDAGWMRSGWISYRISSGIFRRACVWGREDRPDSRRSPDFPERGEPEREARVPGEGKESRKGEKKRGNVTKPIRDGRLVVPRGPVEVQ